MSAAPAEYEVVPQGRIRRVTAKRMLAAANEIPQVTLHAYADAEELMTLRDQLAGESKPSVTLLVARLVADSLLVHPSCNATREDGEIRQHKAVNLSIAVATNEGLVAPVIRDFLSKTPADLSGEFRCLVARAREGQLNLRDLTGGTFTVSNLGNFGVETFTPIVNPPQILILGLGKLTPRIVLDSAGGMAVHRHIPLSLTFDHAALDGDRAGRFLSTLCAGIEQPEHLLAL